MPHLTDAKKIPYYKDQAALENYVKFVIVEYPEYDCRIIHHCPHCNELAAWVDCSRYNYQPGNQRVNDSWVHAVSFPIKKGATWPRALAWCIEDGSGGFNTRDLVHEGMELAIYGAAADALTKQQHKCTCDWDVVMAQGCQCGGR
jgi:hypothetical protein